MYDRNTSAQAERGLFQNRRRQVVYGSKSRVRPEGFVGFVILKPRNREPDDVQVQHLVTQIMDRYKDAKSNTSGVRRNKEEDDIDNTPPRRNANRAGRHADATFSQNPVQRHRPRRPPREPDAAERYQIMQDPWWNHPEDDIIPGEEFGSVRIDALIERIRRFRNGGHGGGDDDSDDNDSDDDDEVYDFPDDYDDEDYDFPEDDDMFDAEFVDRRLRPEREFFAELDQGELELAD
jgi:hypothetical protein